VTRDLTTPGRSPEATFLSGGPEAITDAVKSVVKSPTAEADMKQLIQAAGNTPEASKNARAALWEVVKTMKATRPGIGGTEQWQGNKIKAFLDDPKVTAAAKVAWADNPDDLENIKKVFGALSGAEVSSQARVPGTSGTAQAFFQRGFDARSVSSSIRSVNQGRSSIPSEFLYQVQGQIRNRSRQMQERAIDDLANRVINNPGLAADLLERNNPIDFAARKRMISQKYGLRGSQFMNILDEDEQDPVTRKVMEK
jgi:hypothetical protein